MSSNAVGQSAKPLELKTNLPVLVERAHRFVTRRQAAVWLASDTTGLLKEAQELNSRDRGVEEEAHLEAFEDTCDVGPAWEEDEATEGASVASLPSSSSGPEPSPPIPKTRVGQMARFHETSGYSRVLRRRRTWELPWSETAVTPVVL